MRRFLTILRSIFRASPEWEQVEMLEREVSHLRRLNAELAAGLREFCSRVERGEVRSTCTYNRFKKLLAKQGGVR